MTAVQSIIIINVFVLMGLLLFFVREEWRHRRLTARIRETTADLTFIAHQLRSPLSNLRKYNEFLQSKEFGSLSFAQQEAISRAQESLSESLTFLNRLLARSQLDDAQMENRPSSVKIREIIQGAVDSARPAADKRRQSLSVTGNLRVRVFADPLLLHGILDELLMNAVHYTAEGGAITVAVTDKGRTADIEVRDTGIGISETERPHIFEKFFRGERARSMFAGNGLGLSFVRQFTDKLGGDVRFSSKEGKGTTFTLTLPTSEK